MKAKADVLIIPFLVSNVGNFAIVLEIVQRDEVDSHAILIDEENEELLGDSGGLVYVDDKDMMRKLDQKKMRV